MIFIEINLNELRRERENVHVPTWSERASDCEALRTSLSV